MAVKNCSACDDINTTAPLLKINGFTNAMCTSLKNNTGLNSSSTRDNCDDLSDLNDCLIGNMDDELDAYDTCDWKKFMHKFIPNVWTNLKAIICSMCGIWTRLEKHECEINYLFNGTSFNIKETEQSDEAYIVAGKGVSFYLANGASEHTGDITFRYIAGGLATLNGSCYFYSTNGFHEPNGKVCPNFDLATSSNEDGYRTSNERSANSVWGQTGRPAKGGELIYEIRMKKSQYPQIKQIFAGRGTESNDGAFDVHFHVYTEGQYAFGQHGWCHDNKSDTPGAPMQSGYSWGHIVPPGWIYIQCRMHWVEQMGSQDGVLYTPYGWLGMRTNRDEIPC